MEQKDFIKGLLAGYRDAMYRNLIQGTYGMEEYAKACNMSEEEMFSLLLDCIETVKSYPKYGRIYSDLLRNVYIDDEVESKEEFKKRYGRSMSDATYYRYRANAIKALCEAFFLKVEVKSA